MHLSELILELKKRRETLNVTQEQLAEIAGVGLRTLKQFESGKGNTKGKTKPRAKKAPGVVSRRKPVQAKTGQVKGTVPATPKVSTKE